MDNEPFDLSNFRIPEIAKGTVIPPYVYKEMAEHEREERRYKVATGISIASLAVSVLSLVVAVIALTAR